MDKRFGDCLDSEYLVMSKMTIEEYEKLAKDHEAVLAFSISEKGRNLTKVTLKCRERNMADLFNRARHFSIAMQYDRITVFAEFVTAGHTQYLILTPAHHV